MKICIQNKNIWNLLVNKLVIIFMCLKKEIYCENDFSTLLFQSLLALVSLVF